MERITVIIITEMERLSLRKDVTAAFRKTGDPSLYHFPPVIVLGGASEIGKRITVPEKLTLSDRKGANAWGSYISFINDDAVTRMQEELSLPVIPTGLHISTDPSDLEFTPSVDSVRAYALAEALYDGCSFRIIRQKRL